MATAKKIIAPSLLEATNHALPLIDQQRSQLLAMRSRSGHLVLTRAAVRSVMLEVATVRVIIDEIERSVSEACPQIALALEAQLLEQLSALAGAIGRHGVPEGGAEGTSRSGFGGECDSDRRTVALSNSHPR
jgi:hypothetical protein